MKLTFSSGRFALAGSPNSLAKLAALKTDWIFERAEKVHVTKDIRAAARFRPYADDKAEKIFNRVFVKHYLEPLPSLPSFLDAHQREGIAWVLSRSRAYLAHAPGAGKTYQAIVASLLCEGEGQVLFVVPPQMTVNWEREIGKAFDLMGMETWPSVYVVGRTAHKDVAGWNAEFIICPDSMLTAPWVLPILTKMKKRFVSVDEASRFKESTSQRTIALFGGGLQDGRKSSGVIHDTRHAVLMDGSPMPNGRPMELWAPTYAMAPETIEFLSQEDFGFRYCGATLTKWGAWEFKHSSREKEFKEKMRKSFMHVVGEEQLNHPERMRSLLYISDDTRDAQLKKWDKNIVSKYKPEELDEESSQADLARFRLAVGLSKVKWVAQYAAERITSKNESILLFAHHREVAFELERLLKKYRPGLIIGGTSSEDREFFIGNFQSGKSKLLIGNIDALGRGHNIQRADRVVFAEYSWSDETNKQAEKRASRRGNAKLFVRCDYVVLPDSFDEMMLSSVMRKEERTKRMME